MSNKPPVSRNRQILQIRVLVNFSVLTWLLVWITFLSTSCEGARILAILPTTARSHWIVMEPLLQELAARGHHVTAFTTFPQKSPSPNYTDVDFSYKLPTLVNAMSLEKIKETMPHPWGNTIFINNIGREMCSVMAEPSLQRLLKSQEKFDLLITELFNSDCFTYYAYKFQIPLISITTTVPVPWASERLGIPDNPSYIPNFFVSFMPEMTLWERTYNSLVLLYAQFLHLRVFTAQTRQYAEEIFAESLPPLQEVVANTSLLLVNSYHALTQSRPFPPNVIEVGGIHIRDRKPLPEDLKSVLTSAKNGVILMSFGSLVRSSTLPQAMITTFMKAFSKIPQTVIFKYEDYLPDVPPNVVIRKWLPQRDITEHDNVVAVIIHGGMASTIEAVYFAKPVIGLPFFGDQYRNIDNVVRRGGGLKLDMNNLTEDQIVSAVREITTNQGYKEGMTRLSLQYRDRPMTALQSAVYWTEYVIRHQGAPHLRPASVELPLYQYLLLDVAAFILTTLSVSLYTVYFIFKSILNVFRIQARNNTKSSKKIN